MLGLEPDEAWPVPGINDQEQRLLRWGYLESPDLTELIDALAERFDWCEALRFVRYRALWALDLGDADGRAVVFRVEKLRAAAAYLAGGVEIVVAFSRKACAASVPSVWEFECYAALAAALVERDKHGKVRVRAALTLDAERDLLARYGAITRRWQALAGGFAELQPAERPAQAALPEADDWADKPTEPLASLALSARLP